MTVHRYRTMGVINCSPESFFSGSFRSGKDIGKRAIEMSSQGADIIDIGARSTSPSSPPIDSFCEAERMEAALRELEGTGVTISVDTMRTVVLKQMPQISISMLLTISMAFLTRNMQNWPPIPGCHVSSWLPRLNPVTLQTWQGPSIH